MSSRTRVLVADDSPLFRDLLERDLASKYEIVEGASTLAEVDAALARGPIDVALIDLAWRDEGACLPRMRYWQQLQSTCRIVILTAYDEWSLCEASLQAGATGFAVKGDPFTEMILAIEMASRGEQYISGKVLREPPSSRGPARGCLSRSARRVLELLAEGFTQKQIAKTLGFSVRTVEDHVKAIKRYFGIDSRAKPNWRVYVTGVNGGAERDVV
ncbi:MAG: response regulator transcription factor [Gemmatimonadetes bacterium]|nr:response regulator transcription factor [Gemmatimonadota bacterium]